MFKNRKYGWNIVRERSAGASLLQLWSWDFTLSGRESYWGLKFKKDPTNSHFQRFHLAVVSVAKEL